MNLVTTERAAKEAIAFLENVRPKILRYRENAIILREVMGPILGFHWNPPLICAVGAGKFNDISSRIKSSQLDETEVDKFRKLSLGAFNDPPLIFPD